MIFLAPVRCFSLLSLRYDDSLSTAIKTIVKRITAIIVISIGDSRKFDNFIIIIN